MANNNVGRPGGRFRQIEFPHVIRFSAIYDDVVFGVADGKARRGVGCSVA
jgi:hypothetical protein